MIRSMCAALFAFVLATGFVVSPQSSEAKDRWCQPRWCPQPVYCQPQPVCCQPRATCCQPQPACCETLGAVTTGSYFCGYWKVFNFGSVCYYYAPHCANQMSPMMLAAVCGDPVNPCNDPAGTGAPFCIADGTFKLAKGATRVHSAARLTDKLDQGHNGPSNVHRDFKVKKVQDRMHFVSFPAVLPGNPAAQTIYAKVAQYDVTYEESENPAHIPLRIAIGHEIRGNPNNAIGVTDEANVESTGNPYVFNVTVPVPNSTITVKYQISASTNRN